jgi:hypothetical protein
MRRATEKGRSDNPVTPGRECIHCHNPVAVPQTPLSKAHASNDFDFDTTADSRTVSAAEASLISPVKEVSEAPEYEFLFDTSMDEFLSPFEESYITKYTNAPVEAQISSPSHQKPVAGPVSLLSTSKLGEMSILTHIQAAYTSIHK